MENFPRIGFVVLLAAWLGPIIVLFFRGVTVQRSILFAVMYFILLWAVGFIVALSGNTAMVMVALAVVVGGAWWKAFRM